MRVGEIFSGVLYLNVVYKVKYRQDILDLADLYVEFFEDIAIGSLTHKLLTWHRYVDDTFIVWPMDKISSTSS